MEPRIQYAKTSDGESIAFYSIGQGMPLVHLSFMLPFGHLQLEWQVPEGRAWSERLASTLNLIRYDDRGFGLSRGHSTGFSVDEFVLDMEAVVDELDLDNFAVFAPINAAPVAISYAVRHPERVSHLVLWCARAKPASGEETAAGWQPRMARTNWKTYTETIAHEFVGWHEGDIAQRMASLMRKVMTPDDQDGIQLCPHDRRWPQVLGT